MSGLQRSRSRVSCLRRPTFRATTVHHEAEALHNPLGVERRGLRLRHTRDVMSLPAVQESSDAARGSGGRAEAKATAWLVRSLTVLRIAQLAPGAVMVVTAAGNYHSSAAIRGVFIAEAAWCAVLFTIAVRRGWFTRSSMLADAALQSAVTITVGRLCLEGQATQTANWSVAPVVGASILASLFLSRAALTVVTSVLVGSYLFGVSADLPAQWGNALSNVAAITAFTWAASLVGVRLIKESQSADAAMVRAADEERQRALVEARFDERTRQYLRLHDTVLSTLEGIARGGLDYAETSVRQRCASDANLVRSLNAAVDRTTNLSPLPVVLAHELRHIQAFGLHVHYFNDRIPHTLPPNVVDAAAGAVREALNNVVKHANVTEAWVSTRGHGDAGVLIRIVDRGVGFTPGRLQGRGIDNSIKQRWSDAGGHTTIETGPDGTMVELTWQP